MMRIFAATCGLILGAATALPSTAGAETPSPAPAAVVEMTDSLKYVPPKVTINAGETIEWRNLSALVHTVTADPKLANKPEHVALPEGAKPFNSGSIQPKDNYRYTFTVPGYYKYFCIPHEAAGMIGEVEVREK